MKNVNDLLNFIIPQSDEVLKGIYYSKIPKTPNDSGVEFRYDIVDESDRSYAKILDNLVTEQAIQTIKTNDVCDFKIKGYIVAQDGEFWQITGIVKRLVIKESKHALRLIKETPSTEYVIRLIGVENPWGLR